MPPLAAVLFLLCTSLAALVIPRLALERCRACGELTRRAGSRAHTCPSPRYTMLSRWWTGFVILWTGAAMISAVLS